MSVEAFEGYRPIPVYDAGQRRYREARVPRDRAEHLAGLGPWLLKRVGHDWCAEVAEVTGEHHLLHRLVARAPPTAVVLAVDGDYLHCLPANLWTVHRLSSPLRGVDFDRTTGPRGRWRTRIRICAKSVLIGRWDAGELAEAAWAYDCAAVLHHGRGAVTNYPPEAVRQWLALDPGGHWRRWERERG